MADITNGQNILRVTSQTSLLEKNQSKEAVADPQSPTSPVCSNSLFPSHLRESSFDIWLHPTRSLSNSIGSSCSMLANSAVSLNDDQSNAGSAKNTERTSLFSSWHDAAKQTPELKSPPAFQRPSSPSSCKSFEVLKWVADEEHNSNYEDELQHIDEVEAMVNAASQPALREEGDHMFEGNSKATGSLVASQISRATSSLHLDDKPFVGTMSYSENGLAYYKTLSSPTASQITLQSSLRLSDENLFNPTTEKNQPALMTGSCMTNAGGSTRTTNQTDLADALNAHEEQLKQICEAAIAKAASGPPAWFTEYMEGFRREFHEKNDSRLEKLERSLEKLELVSITKEIQPAVTSEVLQDLTKEMKRPKERHADKLAAIGHKLTKYEEKLARKEKKHRDHHVRKVEKDVKKMEKIAKKVERSEKKHAKKHSPRCTELPDEKRQRTSDEASDRSYYVRVCMSGSEDERLENQFGSYKTKGYTSSDDEGVKDELKGNPVAKGDYPYCYETSSDDGEIVDVVAEGVKKITIDNAKSAESQPLLAEPQVQKESVTPILVDISDAPEEIISLPPEFTRHPAPYAMLNNIVRAERENLEAKSSSESTGTQPTNNPTPSNPTASEPSNTLPGQFIFENVAKIGNAAFQGFQHLRHPCSMRMRRPGHPQPTASTTQAQRNVSPAMAVLFEMGFIHEELNSLLLERHRNDIGATVSDLVRIYREQGQM
ncbi:uncharacterized protein LOC136038110 isoform X2 [Artemia franciscana]|uniref:UBA domain-containing protein n=1 Tax=Artemia franciscana TaxID=6661 RepID=A0AA88LER8_ARTSF|nr:hypothetical protein QYM36_006026 [Artemia franciscana]KAK2718875.1 hypothetical protein QYM36_006026 [Artemia franciscana]KAK2718876.1 hypothetical protein QYM36_006026 [Artemia franciscana]KAK2718877.1 hypothetical protein QYM36_006026 [Artemia franciscana]KAK2718878.1 hypothetical protein QYM36_006026 [Artemia franciscana]